METAGVKVGWVRVRVGDSWGEGGMGEGEGRGQLG